MKKKVCFKVAVCALFLAVLCSSCMTTKTCVGKYKETVGSTYTYAKGKQVWLFWGMLPLGRTGVATPSSGNCQVITRFNIMDLIINSCTGGVITTSTIKVKAKRVELKK